MEEAALAVYTTKLIASNGVHCLEPSGWTESVHAVRGCHFVKADGFEEFRFEELREVRPLLALNI